MTSPASPIEAYLAAFASGEPAKVAGFVADDFENIHLGRLGEGCVGKATYLQRLGTFLTEFRNIRYEVIDRVADDKRAAVVYRMRFEQAGRTFEIDGIMWFTLEGALIRKRIDCWDGLSYLKQAETSPHDLLKLFQSL